MAGRPAQDHACSHNEPAEDQAAAQALPHPGQEAGPPAEALPRRAHAYDRGGRRLNAPRASRPSPGQLSEQKLQEAGCKPSPLCGCLSRPPLHLTSQVPMALVGGTRPHTFQEALSCAGRVRPVDWDHSAAHRSWQAARRRERGTARGDDAGGGGISTGSRDSSEELEARPKSIAELAEAAAARRLHRVEWLGDSRDRCVVESCLEACASPGPINMRCLPHFV